MQFLKYFHYAVVPRTQCTTYIYQINLPHKLFDIAVASFIMKRLFSFLNNQLILCR